jgi:hypothetical protein
MMSGRIDIDVLWDRVVILGQTILRPSSISPGQWFEFWDAYKRRW